MYECAWCYETLDDEEECECYEALQERRRAELSNLRRQHDKDQYGPRWDVV